MYMYMYMVRANALAKLTLWPDNALAKLCTYALVAEPYTLKLIMASWLQFGCEACGAN